MMFDSLYDSAFDFLGSLTPLSAEDFPVETAPEIRPGSIHIIGAAEWIALESFSDGTTALLRKDLLERDMIFGENCDWRSSKIREWLNRGFLYTLKLDVGEENIVPFSRNLISMDGLDTFGVCEDSVSLLTMDEYRKYHRLLGLNPEYRTWWWICTPFSTEENGYNRNVCCVNSDGGVCYDVCDVGNGVRPFILLKSSVLTS